MKRNISAEARTIKGGEEVSGYGMLSNPVYRFLSPGLWLWHGGAGIPSAASLKSLSANISSSVRYGMTNPKHVASDKLSKFKKAVGRFFSPGKSSQVVYCPVCGAPGYAGHTCSRCHTALYGKTGSKNNKPRPRA